ncbi:unnamed protein product [Adineta steineri]|uniref:Uncharacterized protein n=1 Tax=Adineta steineri TaxID=433720 RepID=A0A819QG60_9BILA|nr:unnamed protein product [Adineta steineri]CAF4034657.1 unnamed protein product [Adineta steineri]
MSSVELLGTGQKRQRIMIITADESLIDQIEKSNNISFLEQIILPPENDNSEKSVQHNKVQSSHKKNRPKDVSLVCVICGSSAHGYNFGAITCEGCKAFFRRHARKAPTVFHCDGKGDCKITVETRRFCSACRLAKCFNSGMQCDRLLTVEQKAEKRRQIEENRKLALSSNLSTNEELQLSTPPLSIDSEQTLLNSDDLQRIEAVSCCYQKRIELDVLNSHSVPVMRLLSFFKQIPEFDQLNIDDKVTLIKYNIPTVLSINRALSYNPDTHEFIESSSDVQDNIEFYSVLNGHNTFQQSKKVFLSFLQLVKYDRKIIELALVVLMFTKGISTTNPQDEKILNDTMSVYRAHNYYTELLWKYMETVYGYEKAVSLFSELINHIISLQTVQEEIQKNILRVLSPDNTDELLPIIKSVLCIS